MAATIAEAQPTRRDFLFIATGSMAVVGVASIAWPLIDEMNPDASTLAQVSTEVDVSTITPNEILTVKWQGKPVFIWNRTQAEVDAVRAVPLSDLIDPATDQSRVQKSQWLVVIGICTHLGCVPTGHEGDYGGWLCHCHGSQYDGSGRVRKGPAPANLAVPPYKFTSDTKLTIG